MNSCFSGRNFTVFKDRGAGLEDALNRSEKNDIVAILGKGRAKKGMFEGDLEYGELEIGQITGLIHEIKPAAEIVEEIVQEFNLVKKGLC